MQIFTKEIREDHQEKNKEDTFYLDQRYFTKCCLSKMIKRIRDNMLVKNIFFKEDGSLEVAYLDESFEDIASLKLFLNTHLIDTSNSEGEGK